MKGLRRKQIVFRWSSCQRQRECPHAVDADPLVERVDKSDTVKIYSVTHSLSISGHAAVNAKYRAEYVRFSVRQKIALRYGREAPRHLDLPLLHGEGVHLKPSLRPEVFRSSTDKSIAAGLFSSPNFDGRFGIPEIENV